MSGYFVGTSLDDLFSDLPPLTPSSMGWLERTLKDSRTYPIPLKKGEPESSEEVKDVVLEDATHIFQKFKQLKRTIQEKTELLKEKKAFLTDFEKENAAMTLQRSEMNLKLQRTIWAIQKQKEYEEMFESYKTYSKQYDHLSTEVISHLTQEIVEQEKELNLAQSQLGSISKMIFLGVKELIPEEKRVSNLCPICYETAVNVALDTCGHTFCETCLIHCGANCPKCRSQYQKAVRIYLE